MLGQDWSNGRSIDSKNVVRLLSRDLLLFCRDKRYAEILAGLLEVREPLGTTTVVARRADCWISE